MLTMGMLLLVSEYLLEFGTPTCLASNECHKKKPIPVSWDMLDGQWYWVATVASDESPIYDCSGFRGLYEPRSKIVRIIVTESVHISSWKVLNVSLTNPIVVSYEDSDCDMFPMSSLAFNIGYRTCNILCFYSCGPEEIGDHVSCFSRKPTFGNIALLEIHHVISEDLIYDPIRFTLVNRQYCKV